MMPKIVKIWLSKSIFYVKKHTKLSDFFFIEDLLSSFYVIEIFWLYFLKWCPIFDSSLLRQFSKFNNFPLSAYVDFLVKIFLIFYLRTWNFITCTAIQWKAKKFQMWPLWKIFCCKTTNATTHFVISWGKQAISLWNLPRYEVGNKRRSGGTHGISSWGWVENLFKPTGYLMAKWTK